jgi:hypothetical protein
MDPKATLENALAAYRSGDCELAADMLRNYYEWRNRGGFEPTDGDSKAATLSNLLDELGYIC